MVEKQVKDPITFQIVEIEGRAISGIKLLGMLPEAAYGDEDFSLYVRWNTDHGIVTVDRSDTDERLITQGLTRLGKLEAFQNLMHLLASKYGTDVIVAADPGLKVSAMAAKMIGTYAAPVAEAAPVVEIPALREGVTAEQYAAAQADTHAAATAMAEAATAWVGNVVEDSTTEARPCGVAGCKTGQAGVMLLKVATGPSAKYTNDVVFCGVCWPYYEHSTELGNVLESIPLVDASDIAEANAQAWAEAGSPRDGSGQPVIPTVSDPMAMMVPEVAQVVARVNYFGKVLFGSDNFKGIRAVKVAAMQIDCLPEFVDQAITAGLLVTDGEWLVVAESVVPMIIEPDLIDAWSHFNPGAKAGGWKAYYAGDIDAVMAAHDAALTEWVKPLVKILAPLPVRTPGGTLDTWDMAESDIWAGTESLGSMRVRMPRKAKKARRESKPRPIDVKRARIASGSVR